MMKTRALHCLSLVTLHAHLPERGGGPVAARVEAKKLRGGVIATAVSDAQELWRRIDWIAAHLVARGPYNGTMRELQAVQTLLATRKEELERGLSSIDDRGTLCERSQVPSCSIAPSLFVREIAKFNSRRRPDVSAALAAIDLSGLSAEKGVDPEEMLSAQELKQKLEQDHASFELYVSQLTELAEMASPLAALSDVNEAATINGAREWFEERLASINSVLDSFDQQGMESLLDSLKTGRDRRVDQYRSAIRHEALALRTQTATELDNFDRNVRELPGKVETEKTALRAELVEQCEKLRNVFGNDAPTEKNETELKAIEAEIRNLPFGARSSDLVFRSHTPTNYTVNQTRDMRISRAVDDTVRIMKTMMNDPVECDQRDGMDNVDERYDNYALTDPMFAERDYADMKRFLWAHYTAANVDKDGFLFPHFDAHRSQLFLSDLTSVGQHDGPLYLFRLHESAAAARSRGREPWAMAWVDEANDGYAKRGFEQSERPLYWSAASAAEIRALTSGEIVGFLDAWRSAESDNSKKRVQSWYANKLLVDQMRTSAQVDTRTHADLSRAEKDEMRRRFNVGGM